MATTQSKSNEMAPTPQDTAIRMLAQRNLHQHMWLPQTNDHEKLRVTFSTTSNFSDESLPAFLSIGPMFGSRYGAINYDKLAQENGLRGIAVDRPNIGGSTAVSVEKRLDVWLETVPALLSHLKIEHVSLFTHSAGAIYTLNTLVRLPHILDPKKPCVAFMAPWVHSEHSGVALTKFVSKLPTGVFSVWGDINSALQSVAPAASWSAGALSSISGLFSNDQADGKEEEELEAQDKYGVNAATAKAIDDLTYKYVVAESLKGGGDEALLCSKARKDVSWQACDDYKQCIQSIAEIQQARLNDNPAAAKLKVSLHFAQDDMLIGKGGQRYFEECWNQEDVKKSVDVTSKEYKGTDHDRVVMKLRKGALPGIFEQMKECNK